MNHTLYVPVRMSGAGVLALRTGRLESGERTGLAFTSVDALTRTLGPAQRWVSLGEEPLRDMLPPLGIRQLRVDPLPFGPPDTVGVPRQARKRPAAPPPRAVGRMRGSRSRSGSFWS
ncbi:MAG TPA: SAV_915 family protein [Trebonia sp.]